MDEAVSACGDHLFVVSLLNSLRIQPLVYDNIIRCGLADGSVNHRQLLRRLLTLGYQGPILLGAPRSGDREWFAKQDSIYLRSVLADIGAGAASDSCP